MSQPVKPASETANPAIAKETKIQEPIKPSENKA